MKRESRTPGSSISKSAGKLRQLNLRLTQVTPEGVAALQAAIPELKIASDR